MNRVERVILGFSHLFRTILAVSIVMFFLQKQWINVFLSFLTLFLTFFPAIIEKNYKITLPLEFEFLIILFMFGALFLGEVGDYYEKYWWWDIVLHTLSGVILGVIGFLFVYTLNKDNKIDLHLGAVFVAIFSFSFALSIGTIWEIFEYGMDSFFHLNMQKSGLVDTMWDLIVNSVGALFVSIGGYFYVKKIKTPLFYYFIEKIMIKKS